MEMPIFGVDEADVKFGDYSTNVAMILAKVAARPQRLSASDGGQGDNPQYIAKRIIDALEEIDNSQIIESAEVAGPGFINFKIQILYLVKKIYEINKAGEKFGSSDIFKGKKINIEFISANPTGPLTLGNGRGGYFSDTLANVFLFCGAKVEREYYINDRGVQVTALGHSVLKDSESVYKGSYIDEIAPKITAKTPTEAGMQAAKILTDDYIKKTISNMGIKFDRFFSEQEMFNAGVVFSVLEQLKQLKLTYEKDGALWLKTTKFSDDKDRVLITKEGEHTYFAADIAYHYDKIRRGYDLLIDFWGADHHGYIGRMISAVEILKNQENWSGELKIIIAQFVRLVSKGKEVKMSKRLGTYVTLDELIDEVGSDVTRFFFLDRSLDTHMDFDLDLAKEKSQKNPVFYVQYAYARISSILAKINIQHPTSKIDEGLLKEPEEVELIKQLIKFPEIVSEISNDYQVQKLPLYSKELAQSFHHFYEKCPIIKSGDENLTAARLELLNATKIVLKNTLDLMGISSPKKM